MDERQEILDRFYFDHGPCCAGCDHWRSISALSGECLKGRIVPSAERLSMIGVVSTSGKFGTGHPITERSYSCGLFADNFDWSSLPIGYRKSLGKLPSPPSVPGE